MVKKKIALNEPTISKIPIPVTDSPLVIDLPDGQKVVLGKISNGTVIEVATWRGTGRPDSRTTRIMLGMSDGPQESFNSSNSTTDNDSKIERNSNANIRFVSLNKLQNNLSKIFNQINSQIKKIKLPSRKSKNFNVLKPVEQTTEIEIEQWLSNITDELKSKRSPVVTTNSVGPEKKARKSPKKAAVKKKTSNMGKKK